MDTDEIVQFIAACNDEALGAVAGALLARMMHKWGRAQTLDRLERLLDAAETVRRQRGLR